MTTHATHRKESVEEIEAHLERTREDLASTVDELAARLDVKKRLADRMTPTVVGAAAAAAVLVVAAVVWRRRNW